MQQLDANYSQRSEEALQVRYPPYTEAKLDVVSAEAHLEIPGDH